MRKPDFQQEGWRYDFDENSGKLVYKGVVFNEMKGVYSSSDNIFLENISKNLFVNTIYNHSSGGLPEEIPNLSYEETKLFFQKYYHPSNARVFSYGDLNFTNHLKYLNENYLKNVQAEKTDSEVKASDKLNEIKTVTIKGPPETVSLDNNDKKQIKYAQSFLCNHVV